jgi:hypothetical protein
MSGQPRLNDNAPEDEAELAEPPAHGFVTLFGGMSMCQWCGELWDWDDPRPERCEAAT